VSQVSVILPTFNRAGTLARAIASVLEQTYAPAELIVVDDASSDQTDQVVKTFDDQRLKCLLLPQQSGAAAARNAGIANSHCRFVAFQDSDDQWLPTKLAKQMAVLEGHTQAEGHTHDEGHTQDEGQRQEIGVVYCDMTRIAKDGSRSYYPAPTVDSTALINPFTKQYCVQNIGIGSCLIRRECLQAVGGFNETLTALEDLELFIRLSQKFRFQRIPEALVDYYETDGISSDTLRLAKAKRKLLKLCGPLLQNDRWFVVSELASIAGMESKVTNSP
jgi:glycosyltransferase involved in cell wall biosynthesis